MNNNIMSASHHSYLEIIIGPMYSGKSSRLVEVYNQCTFCNIPVIAINHNIDNRYDEELLSTHDMIKIPCVKTDSLKKIWNDNINANYKIVRYSDVVLINEGQFFADLYETVVDMLKFGKKVYVCGLDGDFERKKFGQILDLQRRTTEGAEGSGGGERGEGGEVTRVRAVEFKEMVEQVCAF